MALLVQKYNFFRSYFRTLLRLLSGLSWKTEICRTKELRTGPCSICPINCCYHSLSLFSNKRSPYYVHSLKTMKKNGFCFFHQNDKCFQFRKKMRKNLVQEKNQFFQGDHFERIKNFFHCFGKTFNSRVQG